MLSEEHAVFYYEEKVKTEMPMQGVQNACLEWFIVERIRLKATFLSISMKLGTIALRDG